MIEELKIVQEIFGDLTGVGIWAIAAYFAYKIMIIGAWLFSGWGVVWFGRWMIQASFSHSIEKGKQESEINGALSRTIDERDDWRRKAEECQHMYKILKEANKSCTD